MENSRESTGELRLSEMETAEMKTEEMEEGEEEEGEMPEEPSQGPPESENGLEEEGPMPMQMQTQTQTQTQTEHAKKAQDDDTEIEEGDCWMLKAGPGAADQAMKPLIGMGRKRRQSSNASAVGMGIKRVNSNMNLHGHNYNLLPMDALAENEIADVKGMVSSLLIGTALASAKTNIGLIICLQMCTLGSSL